MLKGLEGNSCKELLKSLALFSLEKRRGCTFLLGLISLWWPVSGHNEWWNATKMHQGKFRWDMGKSFCMERWSFPGRGYPGKWSHIKLIRVLGGSGQCSYCMVYFFSFARSRELYLMILKGLLQFEIFCDSMILNQILQLPHICWGHSLPLFRGSFLYTQPDFVQPLMQKKTKFLLTLGVKGLWGTGADSALKLIGLFQYWVP